MSITSAAGQALRLHAHDVIGLLACTRPAWFWTFGMQPICSRLRQGLPTSEQLLLAAPKRLAACVPALLIAKHRQDLSSSQRGAFWLCVVPNIAGVIKQLNSKPQTPSSNS